MGAGFDLREHTADVAVEARADGLGDLFAAVADGMAAAMCDEIPDAGGERFALDVSASTRERLLYDYLDDLIYERDVRGVLPVDNEATVTGPGDDAGDTTGAGAGAADAWSLSASARGVPLRAVAARDLKAVTFSEMRIEETGGRWTAYVVFDV